MSASLVEHGQRYLGRFEATPLANPLDQFRGPRRAYERFRTKEWVGFTLVHRDMAGSMIIQDAKYMVTGELYVYDRADDVLAQYAANKFLASGKLPANLLQNRCTFTAGAFGLGYDFSDDEVVVAINIAGASENPGVKGRLTLDARHASSPLVVSALLPGGNLYTNKIVYPADGEIVCGDRRYTFDPSHDFAILDEHKSHLPYRTDWTWGTFAMMADGHIVGANLATRPSLEGQEEESCIWTPEGTRALTDVSFTQTGDDMSVWHITSADGRIDVTFTPQGHKDHKMNLGILALQYAQWFGHYNGTMRDGDQEWKLENVPGVCERMHARL